MSAPNAQYARARQLVEGAVEALYSLTRPDRIISDEAQKARQIAGSLRAAAELLAPLVAGVPQYPRNAPFEEPYVVKHVEQRIPITAEAARILEREADEHNRRVLELRRNAEGI